MKKYRLYTATAPSYIWRIKDLEPEEKIVLFQMYAIAANGASDKWNDYNFLSYTCGFDEMTTRGIMDGLVEKGFLHISFLKPWLTGKLENYVTEKDYYEVKTNSNSKLDIFEYTPQNGDYIGKLDLTEKDILDILK